MRAQRTGFIALFLLVTVTAAWAQYEPAPTPALPPAEAEKRFTVPEGFEVRLFAAEPDIVNPVAMSWDARGRLWILELIEYPLGAKEGTKPRDRVKILEDTDGDGRADKFTVFADGLNIATGLIVGDGGAYVGQAPDLLFLKDTNGDDVADERTVLLTGFAREDRHELLNGFAWGPDGWLWMTQGVFNHSKVKDPNRPGDDGLQMNAAIARFHPRTRKFEIVADGTSNPWGVDFDRAGNAFVSACVIDHLFHIVPGGSYVRQAGTPGNPYAYDLLPSIVDHKHQRAAYCGICIYQGDQFPEEYRGNAYMGNIHGNCINRDKLTPDGSTFRATALPDFLAAHDGWFRPISEQVGPDGAMWIADWYDKFPCYQNAMATPELIDREKGRIWRVVYTGKKVAANEPVGAQHAAPLPSEGSPTHAKPIPPWPYPGEDLAKWPSDKLVGLLAHPNVWQRRTGQRLLSERRDSSTKDVLTKIVQEGPSLEERLAALWTSYGAGQIEENGKSLKAFAKNPEPAVRVWTALLCTEFKSSPDEDNSKNLSSCPSWQSNLLTQLTRDLNPSVCLGVSVALRRMALEECSADAILGLTDQAAKIEDPLIAFMLWTVWEKHRMYCDVDPRAWSEARDHPLIRMLLKKSFRRLCDDGQPKSIDRAVSILATLTEKNAAMIPAALEGLLEGQQGKVLKPTTDWAPVLRKLGESPDPAVAGRATRLAALWGDPAATAKLLKAAADPAAPVAARLEAIQTARHLKDDTAREALLAVFAAESTPPQVLVEAIRALADVGGEKVPDALLSRWKALPADARRAAVDVLASRPAWAAALLRAVEAKNVTVAEIPAAARRALAQIEDPAVKDLFGRALGKFRQTPEEKTKLVAEKKSMILNGPVDVEAGHAVMKKTCLTCHTFLGEGANVGPDLTGSGRATLDALLTNVIDPNQIIGKGYENVVIQTVDERTVSGRIVEETPEHVTLLAAGPKQETVAVADIASKKITDQSVMPEGLWQMPDADFRNLIWYVFAPAADPTVKLRVERAGEGVAVLGRRADGSGWAPLAALRTAPGEPPTLEIPRGASGAAGDPIRFVPRIGQIAAVKFSDGSGKVRFDRLLDVRQEEGRAGWRAAGAWAGPEGDVLEDEQTVTVHDAATPGRYVVDVAWTLRPVKKKGWTIIVGHDANGLTARWPASPSPAILTTAGPLSAGSPVKPADGCDVVFPAADAGRPPFGVTWLSHPTNPAHPPGWRAADGELNPAMNPFGDWGVHPEHPRTYRYRLIVHEGPMTAEALAAEAAKYGASSGD